MTEVEEQGEWQGTGEMRERVQGRWSMDGELLVNCDRDRGGNGSGDWGEDKLLQGKGARASCLTKFNHLLM